MKVYLVICGGLDAIPDCIIAAYTDEQKAKDRVEAEGGEESDVYYVSIDVDVEK